MDIKESTGYLHLLEAVINDEAKVKKPTDQYREKFKWVLERARHYGEYLEMDPADILNAWENARDYWYMNYYQDATFPLLNAKHVRVFATSEEAGEAIGILDFRCPACGGISKSPYECTTGQHLSPGKICDWKSYGLFRTLGKGVYVYVKSAFRGVHIFKPIAWEEVESKGKDIGNT